MNNFSIIPSKQILLYNEQLAMDSEQPQYYTMNTFSIIPGTQILAMDSNMPKSKGFATLICVSDLPSLINANYNRKPRQTKFNQKKIS